MNFRSEKTFKAYEDYKKVNPFQPNSCPLCEKPALREFTHFRIVNNNFPYDKIAAVHHMIVPRVHLEEKDLTLEMYQELVYLKETYINDNYSHIIEALPKNKSIPNHFHLHVIEAKAF
jgi:hypothetical protein